MTIPCDCCGKGIQAHELRLKIGENTFCGLTCQREYAQEEQQVIVFCDKKVQNGHLFFKRHGFLK